MRYPLLRCSEHLRQAVSQSNLPVSEQPAASQENFVGVLNMLPEHAAGVQ